MAVREAVAGTCSYLTKTGDTGKLLWLLRLCPEQFRPPALSPHALSWSLSTCGGLLLEYATRGWDAQLATTMKLLEKSDGPAACLSELAKLASMFFAYGHKPKHTEIALAIFKSVGEVFKKKAVYRNSFLAELSPQLLSAAQNLAPLEFKDLSLEWTEPKPLQVAPTPEQLRERLGQDTGILHQERDGECPKSCRNNGTAC